MTVELDTIRGSFVSLSATEGAESQVRLAGDVRSLRERMGTVADSMAEVYEPPPRCPPGPAATARAW